MLPATQPCKQVSHLTVLRVVFPMCLVVYLRWRCEVGEQLAVLLPNTCWWNANGCLPHEGQGILCCHCLACDMGCLRGCGALVGSEPFQQGLPTAACGGSLSRGCLALHGGGSMCCCCTLGCYSPLRLELSSSKQSAQLVCMSACVMSRHNLHACSPVGM